MYKIIIIYFFILKFSIQILTLKEFFLSDFSKYNLNTIIEGENFKSIFYNYNNIEEINNINKNNNLSSIIFNEKCFNDLIKNNNNNINNIIILKIDILNDIFNKVFYFVYSNEFNLVDLSLCNNINNNISIYKYFNNNDNYINNKDLELIYKENNNFDIFNKNNKFFNERCTQFNDHNNYDIPLNLRREIYFRNNILLCNNDDNKFCEYVNYYYNNNSILCNCVYKNINILNNEINNFKSDSNNIINDDNVNNNDINVFIKKIKNFNADIIKCSSFAFNKNIFKGNYLFYIALLIIIINIIICFIYFINDSVKLFKENIIYLHKEIVQKEKEKEKEK